MSRDRIQNAILKFNEKQLPKKNRQRRHNKKPEANFVLILKNKLESMGWDCDIVEAKGVYNAQAGRYLTGKTRPGFSDICGNTKQGRSIYIEAKAPGKRSTIRPDQHEFLTRKIKTNCFAIVCDSLEYLESTFNAWLLAEDKIAYLLSELPSLTDKWKSDLDFDIE